MRVVVVGAGTFGANADLWTSALGYNQDIGICWSTGTTVASCSASNLLGFIVPIVIIGGGGVLFFKLVRVLSRLQMPAPPAR